MRSVKNSRVIKRTSRRRFRDSSRERLSNKCQALCQENAELTSKLDEEKKNFFSQKNLTVQLRQELAETRDQLERQKTLKEMFINRGKETKRDLERLQKYSDPVTLNNTKTATQVRNNAKRKKKKDLQADYEELQVSHIINGGKFTAEIQVDKDSSKLLQDELERTRASHNQIILRYETDVINARQQVDNLLRELENGVQQHKRLQKDYEEQRVAHMFSQENFTAQLHAEREKSRLLQEELEKISFSRHEISKRYETDVIAVRQQVDTLQRELEQEVKSHADTVSEDCHLISNLRAEQNALREKMAEEINVLQQNTSERERSYVRELEEQKMQLNVQLSLNLELSTKLEAEREDYRLPRKRARREEKCVDEPCQQQEMLPDIGRLTLVEVPEETPCKSTDNVLAPKLLEEAQVLEENLPETAVVTPSIWKRTRHFLGLRKPKK